MDGPICKLENKSDPNLHLLTMHSITRPPPLDFQTLRRPYIFFCHYSKDQSHYLTLGNVQKSKSEFITYSNRKSISFVRVCLFMAKSFVILLFFAMLLSRTRPLLCQNVKNAILGKSGIAGLTCVMVRKFQKEVEVPLIFQKMNKTIFLNSALGKS